MDTSFGLKWFAMSAQAEFKIDVSETFERLPKAPIIEAVIDLRVPVVSSIQEESLRERLDEVLTKYEFVDSRRALSFEMTMEQGKSTSHRMDDHGWKGLRYKSSNGLYLVQFNRDGLVFSHLAPYEAWDAMFAEAERLWSIYVEIAEPVEIARIGLRYINSIQLAPGQEDFEQYLASPPQTPRGLNFPFINYMHQSMLQPPGYPYVCNIINTLQRPSDIEKQGVALILDIDVYTTNSIGLDREVLEKRLLEMRWLKNKAFLGSVTDEALKLFRETT